jgi:hypothetical protein
MTPRTLRALFLCVLSRLASGECPRHHDHLHVAAWLVGKLHGSHLAVPERY